MPKKETIQKAHPKIVIPLSEADLQELMAGEEFRWTFTTDKGQDIDVLLRPEAEEDFEIEEDGTLEDDDPITAEVDFGTDDESNNPASPHFGID